MSAVEETATYRIRVVLASGAASKLGGAEGVVSYGSGGLRIGGARVTNQEDEIAKAVGLAKTADQVVLFVGLNSDFEREGHDRPHMDLPGRTSELVSAVAEANSKTVVVVQSGSLVSMP
ncbi:beta-glucosidase [Fusarium piperis]|uniref:Beta-glucosidase n=1 Tax=Fusarium piperis TaxID=1435070 RepID=A0A9W8W8X2_9HYPO|nr:beta-glucosidase [Fusarium piperis]